MQVTVTLTFDSEAAAAAYLASKETPKPGKPAKADAPAASPPSAAETKTTPPADAPAKAPAPAPAPAADPAADYLKSGLPELIQKAAAKDRAGVIALLSEFKVKKGAELKPDQFDAFKVKVEALLAPADDLS